MAARAEHQQHVGETLLDGFGQAVPGEQADDEGEDAEAEKGPGQQEPLDERVGGRSARADTTGRPYGPRPPAPGPTRPRASPALSRNIRKGP